MCTDTITRALRRRRSDCSARAVRVAWEAAAVDHYSAHRASSDRGPADSTAMAIAQHEKGEAFRALHEGEPFVIPNPWDAGSARVLESLEFKSLATTSGGIAFSAGRLDGGLTLDAMIEATREIVDATDLPVSVDLENGFGPEPQDAATAITRAAEAGAVGGSIEDFDHERGIYER